MSPQGLAVPNVSPRWEVDLTFPYRAISPGQSIDQDWAGGVPGSANNVVPSIDGGSGSAVGADSDTQGHLGLWCIRHLVDVGAVEVFNGWTFEHANPFLAEAADVAPGARVEDLQVVTIFDLWLSFGQAAYTYDAGRTGFFFVAPTTGINNGQAPGGGGPQTYLGLQVVSDGGLNSIRYGAWNNAGGLLDSAPAPSTFSPLLWNHARLVFVGARVGVPAQLLEARVNGTLIAGPVDFGSAQLQRPSTLNGATHGMLSLLIASDVTTAPALREMYWRWRLRTGRFRPDGTAVR